MTCDTGKCTCNANSDCHDGKICDAGSCVPCETTEQCDGSMTCDAGSCTCTSSSDCLDGKICDAGTCVPPCTENEQCDGELICDVDDGSCKTCSKVRILKFPLVISLFRTLNAMVP